MLKNPLLVFTALLVGLESRLVCFNIPCRLPDVVAVVAGVATVAIGAAIVDGNEILLTSTNFDGRFEQNTGFELLIAAAVDIAIAALLTAFAPGLLLE